MRKHPHYPYYDPDLGPCLCEDCDRARHLLAATGRAGTVTGDELTASTPEGALSEIKRQARLDALSDAAQIMRDYQEELRQPEHLPGALQVAQIAEVRILRIFDETRHRK